MQIKARRCFVPRSPSDWVAKVFLTCDNKIAVQFKHGQHVRKILPHGPGAYVGHGGVPQVCCLYPGTQGELAETLYELAQAWSYAGEWVHAFLYRKFGYVLVAPPVMCGGCNTSCAIALSPATPNNGDSVAITVTVTNNDGGSKGEAPEGTVSIAVDGAGLCTQSLAEDEPDSKNWQSVSCNWTATCTPQDTHTITATYTPAAADWTSTSCATSVTVGNCGISTTCCPGVLLPTTLHVTVTGDVSGTYPLTSSGSAAWTGSFPVCGGTTQITVACLFGSWSLTMTGAVSGWTAGSPTSPPGCGPLQLVFAGTGTCISDGSPVSLTLTITA